MPKPKTKAGGKVGIYTLVEPEQKAALEEIGKRDTRSVGYLVREAITLYLASVKKKP